MSKEVGFSGPLVTEQTGHQLWRIERPFRFVSVLGIEVDILAGFETDLASIPAIAQSLVSKVGYWSQAAVVHDLLYSNHRTGVNTTISRMDADRILLEGCKIRAHDFKVPDSERRDWLIFGGVVAGGLSSWETPKERSERLARNALEEHILDQ